MSNKEVQIKSSSQGHSFSDEAQLDRHFILAQPEYETMLQAAGLQTGWRVLDAGCGVGSFLPLMSRLVGPSGHITAMDVASENVEVVNRRMSGSQLNIQCPIVTRVGSVLSLPDAEGAYDAVWCSAVTQYLSDEELRLALSEFRCVVRPGGMVIVKDFQASCWHLQPMDPTLLWRFLIAAQKRNHAYITQILRNIWLSKFVREAGLNNVRSSTYLIERFAPISDNDRILLTGVIEWIISLASTLSLPEEEIAAWKRLIAEGSRDCVFDTPNYHYIESHSLITSFVH